MKEIIAKILKAALKEESVDLKEEEIIKLIEVPPNSDMGDFAFPCFIVASKLKQQPHQVALQVRANIKEFPKEFVDVQTQGPYVNFFLDRKVLALGVVNEVLKQGDNFGKGKISNLKTMVEFSQANTHKAFHVGHLRGTSLGESLARISEFSGDKVIRANYQGDTGMHVAKWIWCYTKYHSRQKLKKDESWIASIYVDAVKRLAKNEKLQEEVNIINKKLEDQSDSKLNSLWKRTRKLSLDAFEKIYKDLNTKFDVYFFEGDVEQDGKKISKQLLKNKIAKISDGATIMNLKKYGLGVWVLLRKDGTVLYSGKDLALAQKKFRHFKIDNSIYVIGAAQSLHMKQLIKTLELMKFAQVNMIEHVSYSEVRLPHGKMSSRTGENILYSDFMKEITEYASKEIKKREKISKKEADERALKVAIASIKYNFLKQNSRKVIVFDKKEALNFEGNTGPYLLYSYARANSILKKAKLKNERVVLKKLEAKELELVTKISKFKEVVGNSYNQLNPSLIANYSYQLAQTFNEFYHACPVIGSDQEAFRLKLVESFKQVLKNSLYLLGIEVLERM